MAQLDGILMVSSGKNGGKITKIRPRIVYNDVYRPMRSAKCIVLMV